MAYWIYPGYRRPVVVEAHERLDAEEKVRSSPQYDGFGSKVYTIEEFAIMCEVGTAP